MAQLDPQKHISVGIYARVSTVDKTQDPETQLLPLRDFAAAQGWDIFRVYVDHAPATDLYRRFAWRDLLEDASKRRFDVVLVWRIDRAFRSVLDAATTLERLRGWSQVLLRVLVGHYITPRGGAVLHHRCLRRAGARDIEGAGQGWMERARRQGHRIGRPRVTDRKGFKRRFGDILERLNDGAISRRQAANELGIGYATLKRLLDSGYLAND